MFGTRGSHGKVYTIENNHPNVLTSPTLTASLNLKWISQYWTRSLNEALDNVYAHQYNTTRVIQMLQMWCGMEFCVTYSTSPIVKLSVVSPSRPSTSSKQWSLYTTTLNTHWLRLGRVVML